MTPNADQIARTIIATASVTGAKPDDVMTGQFPGIYGGRVGKARAASCFALACVSEREPEAWSTRFGWNANENSARNMLGRNRIAGILRGPVIEAAADALGIAPSDPIDRDSRVAAERRHAAAKKRADARAAKAEASRKSRSRSDQIAEAEALCVETAKAARAEIEGSSVPAQESKAPPPKSHEPAPKTQRATSEDEAAKRLLGSIPSSRAAVTSSTVQGGAGPRKGTVSSRGSDENTAKKVSSRASIDAMRDSLIRRPAPTPLQPEALPNGVAPLDTAFMGEFERRVVLRCQQLQKGGSGLNDIRRDLLTEMQAPKSMDWIARACVTVVEDKAA